MKLFIKVGSILCASAALAAVAAASDISGTWHGHLKVDLTKIHQPRTSGEKAKMVAHIKKIQKDSTTLVLKSDHSFMLAVDNDKTVPMLTGTWKQTGGSIVLAGKANSKMGPTNQSLTVSSDGKMLTTSFGGAQFTFRR